MYLCSIEILALSVCHSSSVEGFQVVGLVLDNFGALVDNIRRFVELQVSLSKVEPKSLEQLFGLSQGLMLHKVNSLLVIISSTLCISNLQFFVAAFLQSQSTGQLLLVTVLPFLLLLVLEVQELHLKV